MEQHELQAYASAFVSFLLNKIGKDISYLQQIILFGSVAKGEATKESDVDLFVDTKKKNVEAKIKRILIDFYKSREAVLFKTKGIENDINLKIGQLEQWKDLHASVAATGFVLWGKYHSTHVPHGSKHMVIFSWDNVGKNRGAFLNKLYGFTVHDRSYKGLLDEFGGEKVGKSSIIVPIDCRDTLVTLFQKHKVSAKHFEVFVKE